MPRTVKRIGVSLTLMLSLGGCATKTPPSAVSCPQPPQIPVHLIEPRSQSALDFSIEVQSYLQDAQGFASRTQRTLTPSEQ